MSEIPKIVDQLVSSDDVPVPELNKVVIRVRSGGDILPPTWLKQNQPQCLEPSKK